MSVLNPTDTAGSERKQAIDQLAAGWGGIDWPPRNCDWICLFLHACIAPVLQHKTAVVDTHSVLLAFSMSVFTVWRRAALAISLLHYPQMTRMLIEAFLFCFQIRTHVLVQCTHHFVSIETQPFNHWVHMVVPVSCLWFCLQQISFTLSASVVGEVQGVHATTIDLLN